MTEKHLPETIGGYSLLTFEGALLQYSPHMGAGCGGLYIHQVAKYRVDKIVQGEYGGHEIVVDHPACDENVFKDMPLGSRVRLVVSMRQSYNVVTIFPGIREHENPSLFYIAETEPIIRANRSGILSSQSNKRLQRTGISVPLIDNLPLAQLRAGR